MNSYVRDMVLGYAKQRLSPPQYAEFEAVMADEASTAEARDYWLGHAETWVEWLVEDGALTVGEAQHFLDCTA